MRIAVVVALVACKAKPEPATSHAVATAREPIKIDGELAEPSWNRLGDPQVFTLDGREARPYSQIRFLHDADTLYVGLYAADQDIRSTDTFDLTIGSLALAIDARAHVRPEVPGLRAAKDLDGTLDKPDDDDEEWVIELAIPLAAIRDAEPIATRASRCDTTKANETRCGAWTGALVLAR